MRVANYNWHEDMGNGSGFDDDLSIAKVRLDLR